MLGVFTVKTATRLAQLMQLQVKNAQKTRNNVFRPKQTTNKVSCKTFRDFELGKKVFLVFQKPKNKAKDLWNIFSC